MARTYDVRLAALATIHDDGTVDLDIDFVPIPWEIENDLLAEHDPAEIKADIERVREAFMHSPFNHSIRTRLATD